MKHLIIAVLMLMCVMGAASALTCTCGDVCVNTTGWWNNSGAFNASGVPIQDAVNNATAGETICVKDGTYNENVDVATRLTIRSENGSSVTTVNASNPNDYVFEVTVSYVNISGFTVENATGNSMSGIRLTGASYCNISYNDAIANWHGIYLYNGCGHNNITNNNASSSIQIGVLLHWVCSNNNIIDNVAYSNTFHGFRIKEYGNYNLVKNNTANNNIDNGFYLYDSCNYNTIIDNTMNFNVDGIRVAKCHYTNVSNNTFANNTKGFHIIASRNNSFTCNYVHNSTGHGFYLTNTSPAVPGGVDSADNNISYNNIITNGWQFNTSQASSADAKNNYWGTTVSSEIAASIGENTGSVAYTPFLTWYSSCAPGYRPQSVSYIPPDPINIANSTGDWWVNHTWQPGSGNVTDSYSTNVNGIWYNGTANTHYNDTYSPLGWQNITVYAWNATGTGTLSAGSVSQNTQAPPPNTIVHTIPANQYGLIRKNGTADQTASEVAATIANDTCYAWFDKFWQGYRVVHGYNANTVIPKHQAYFVYVIAETDITCIITSAESVSIPEGYYLTYLREYTPKTLTAIKTDMGPNVNSLYAWTGTAWTDTGTHSVEPNEGLFVISSAAFVWDGSVP